MFSLGGWCSSSAVWGGSFPKWPRSLRQARGSGVGKWSFVRVFVYLLLIPWVRGLSDFVSVGRRRRNSLSVVCLLRPSLGCWSIPCVCVFACVSVCAYQSVCAITLLSLINDKVVKTNERLTLLNIMCIGIRNKEGDGLILIHITRPSWVYMEVG